MKTRLAYRLLSVSLALLVASCGVFESEERDTWRERAEAACFASGAVQLSSAIRESGRIDGKGVCGIERGLSVSALADGSVSVGREPVVLSCPMTAALDRWVKDVVMPAAYRRYGVPVVNVRTMGTYNCRTRNNKAGARLSEHAFANAFDFSGVELSNGYSVSVKSGWGGSEADRAFLREIAAGACGPFTTFLGPGSDGLHEDHFHLDLARHNAKGTYRYCRPRPAIPDATDAPMMASAPSSDQVPPGMQSWPKVLPQTVNASAAQPLPPMDGMPSMTVPAAPVPVQPVYTQPAAAVPTYEAPLPAQPPGCPPGYICTPLDNAAASPATPPQVGPAALGWQVGAQPSADDVTGALGGYSDH